MKELNRCRKRREGEEGYVERKRGIKEGRWGLKMEGEVWKKVRTVR